MEVRCGGVWGVAKVTPSPWGQDCQPQQWAQQEQRQRAKHVSGLFFMDYADNGRPWSTMVDDGRPWTTMVDYGRQWSTTMVDHGRPWSVMVDHGRPWSTMVDHRWPTNIRSDGNLPPLQIFEALTMCHRFKYLKRWQCVTAMPPFQIFEALAICHRFKYLKRWQFATA